MIAGIHHGRAAPRTAATRSTRSTSAEEKSKFESFLSTGEGVEHLQAPKLAVNLRALQQKGVTHWSGDPLASYEKVINAQLTKDAVVTLKRGVLTLLSLPGDQLAEPLPAGTAEVVDSLAALESRAGVAQKNLAKKSPIPLLSRTRLLTSLMNEFSDFEATKIYQQVLKLARGEDRLSALEEEVKDLRGHLPEANAETILCALNFVESDLPSQLPGKHAAKGKAVFVALMGDHNDMPEVNQQFSRWLPVIRAASSAEVASDMVHAGLEPTAVGEWLDSLSPTRQRKETSAFAEAAAIDSPEQAWELTQWKRPSEWVKRYDKAVETAHDFGDPTLVKGLLETEGLDPLRAVVAKRHDFGNFNPEGSWAIAQTDIGRAWTDSPNGDYASNSDVSLTTRSIDLTEVTAASLELEYGCNLDSYDWTFLEVSRDGTTWERLRYYGGKHPQTRQNIDLGAYDGQQIKLRVRLTSDSSGVKDGFHLKSLKVRGGSGQVPFSFEAGSPATAEVVRSYGELDAEGQTAQIDVLNQLEQGLESVGAAVELLPLAAPEHVQPLTRLARTTDVMTAESLWKQVDLEQSVEPQVDHLVNLWQLARSAEDDPAARLKLTLRLHEARIPEPLLEKLSYLTQNFRAEPGWAETGNWGPERHPDDGSWCWSDSPGTDYPSNADNSLVTPLVQVGEHPRLSFDYKVKFEQNSDFLNIDCAPANGPWQNVARLTHSGAKQKHIELPSRFKNQQIRVRFRVSSDSSKNFDGAYLRDIRVGDFRINDGRRSQSDLLNWFVALPGDQRESSIERLRLLSSELGSVAGALTLYDENLDADDTSGLGEVGWAVGVPKTRILWEAGLAEAGGKAPLVAEVADYCSDGPGVVKSLAKLQKGQLKKMARLLGESQPTQGWEAEGSWGPEVHAKLGRVLTESPGGYYAHSQDISLVSPVVDLRSATSAHLRFQRAFDLEKGSDGVSLEYRTIPGDWNQLHRFTGKSGFSEEFVELSPVVGERVQLRFRFQSDSSKNRDGFQLGSLELDTPDGVALRLEHGQLGADELVDLVVCAPPEERNALLRDLESLNKTFDGDLGSAVKLLWNDGGPVDMAKVSAFGLNDALKLPAEIDLPEARAARELHRLLGGPSQVEYWSLSAASLKRVDQAALAGLLNRARTLEQFGPPELPSPWRQISDESGVVWQAPADGALSLEQSSFWRKTGAQVSFEYQSQDGGLQLEVRPLGGDWKALGKWSKSQSGHKTVNLSSYDSQIVNLRFKALGGGVTLARPTVSCDQGVLSRFDPGSPRIESALDALEGSPENLEMLRAMMEDFGGLRPAVTIWPLVQECQQARNQRGLALVRGLTRAVGPTETLRLAPGALELKDTTVEGLTELSHATRPFQLDQATMNWLMPHSDAVESLKLLKKEEASTILMAFRENEETLLSRRSLSEALHQFVLSGLDEGELEHRLAAFMERVSAPEIITGEGWVDVGGQVLEIEDS